VIRAPAAGSVTALNAAQGRHASTTGPAADDPVDLSVVWVTALVPERDLGAVAKGSRPR